MAPALPPAESRLRALAASCPRGHLPELRLRTYRTRRTAMRQCLLNVSPARARVVRTLDRSRAARGRDARRAASDVLSRERGHARDRRAHPERASGLPFRAGVPGARLGR